MLEHGKYHAKCERMNINTAMAVGIISKSTSTAIQRYDPKIITKHVELSAAYEND